MKISDLLKHKYTHFTAAAVVVGAGAIFAHEGLVLHVYPDPATKAAPYTYCYGLTANPQFGHKYTVVECQDETLPTIEHYAIVVDGCLTRTVPDKVAASFIDFSYNIGGAAFCGSTMLRLANAGSLVAACKQFERWTKPPLKGLILRRGDEEQLCLEGLGVSS